MSNSISNNVGSIIVTLMGILRMEFFVNESVCISNDTCNCFSECYWSNTWLMLNQYNTDVGLGQRLKKLAKHRTLASHTDSVR